LNNKIRGLILGLVGIVLLAVGAVAVFFLFQQTMKITTVQPTAVPVVKSGVVVAAHDMFLGEILAADDMTLVEVPAELVPRDALGKLEDAQDKYIKSDMVQGEMVLQHNLADPTNKNKDLGFILSQDHVLMAFPANDLISKHSMIQRGDLVDIFATIVEQVQPVTGGEQLPDQEPVTRFFTFDAFPRVEVTAMVMSITQTEAEQQQGQPAGGVDVLNPPARSQISIQAYLLALKPQDALVLKYLKDRGAIFDLVLRAPANQVEFGLTPVTDEYIVELYGLEILP
jgi:Flp pilus assembly protein CpaB